MDVVIEPHRLKGTLRAISSKSHAHRLLILAGMSDGIVDLNCPTTSEDIEATADCLRALGARITRTTSGYRVCGRGYGKANAASDMSAQTRASAQTTDISNAPLLNARESGSTLRFLLPVVATLPFSCYFLGRGRLSERPLEPLYSELTRHKVVLSPEGSFPLECKGPLQAGHFELPGNVSSQFISGLLMAAPFMQDELTIDVTHPFQSKSYVNITIDALNTFGISVEESEYTKDDHVITRYRVPAQTLVPPREPIDVEGDWSNASFWLCASAISPAITLSGLSRNSFQGDRNILACLCGFGAKTICSQKETSAEARVLSPTTLSLADIVDLAPPLAGLACFAKGRTTLKDAHRLALKESNRILSISRALTQMGAQITSDADAIYIDGTGSLRGGCEVDAQGDHRIAMMTAICAAYAQNPTTILGADCVNKSYPGFFDDFISLGGYMHMKED